MAHGGKVIDLIGLALLDYLGDIHRIGQIPVMEYEIPFVNMRILVKMIDPFGVKQ